MKHSLKFNASGKKKKEQYKENNKKLASRLDACKFGSRQFS